MIRGLGDYKKEEKKDKKGTDAYSGGEKSGLAVEHPDDVTGIIEKAKQASREQQEKGGNKGGPPKTEIKITLYSNGFVVDD